MTVFVWWRPTQTSAQSSCPNFHPQPSSDISSGCPPALNIPLNVYNQYVNHYNNYLAGNTGTPNFRTWISPQGTPSAITATVNANDTSVSLNLQFSAVKAGSGSTVVQSYERVTGTVNDAPGSTTTNLITSPPNSGNNSLDSTVIYGSTYPSYRRDPRTFTWNVPGGFTQSYYNFEIRHRIISRRSGGGFNCIKEPGDPATYGPPTSETNFGVCPILTPDIDLFVEVVPYCIIAPISATINRGDSVTLSWRADASTAAYLNGQQVATRSSMVVTPTSSTVYRLQAVNENGSYTCTSTITVNEPPPPPSVQKYLRIYGNDVIAGGGFGSPCSNFNGNAKIESYAISQGSGSSQDWKGSSTQMAAFALGPILNFFTANMRGPHSDPVSDPLTVPRPPVDLAFGNSTNGSTRVNMNQAGYSGVRNCITDYFSRKGSQPVTTGTVDVPGATIPVASHQARYFEGNVHIYGNQIYANSDSSPGWTRVEDIPSQFIIVKGNIDIDPFVTRLDGIYIAQPDDSGNGGIINTCANSHNVVPPVSSCGQQLVINGGFIARQVRFKRTGGDINAATANEPASSASIAEVFNFSPEVYLSPLHSTLTNGGGATTKYDYITSLPPVL